MTIECKNMDWDINVFGENKISVNLTCVDFEQAVRFIKMLKEFVRLESVQTKGQELRFGDSPSPPWMRAAVFCEKCGKPIVEPMHWVRGNEHWHIECKEKGDIEVMNTETKERDEPLEAKRLDPWQIDRATFQKWGEGSAVRHAAMRAFYKQVTPDVFRLDAYVDGTRFLPSEFEAYYIGIASIHAEVDEVTRWLLRIDLVPPELRECYPNLRPKCNAVEHGELPEWQRAMYARSDDDGRYKLRDEYAAWCAS